MKCNKVSVLLMAAVLVLTLPARAEDAFVIREDTFIQEDSAQAEIVSEEPVLSETELEEGVPEEGVPEESLQAEAEPEKVVPEEPLPAEAVQGARHRLTRRKAFHHICERIDTHDQNRSQNAG